MVITRDVSRWWRASQAGYDLMTTRAAAPQVLIPAAPTSSDSRSRRFTTQHTNYPVIRLVVRPSLVPHRKCCAKSPTIRAEPHQSEARSSRKTAVANQYWKPFDPPKNRSLFGARHAREPRIGVTVPACGDYQHFLWALPARVW